MKTGDICRIVRQSPKQSVQLVGEVALIQEILEEYASIETLRIDGSVAGAGCVPLDCLELETNSQWLQAKEKRDQYLSKISEEATIRTNRWIAKLEEVANKHNITIEQVKEIRQELTSFIDDLRY